MNWRPWIVVLALLVSLIGSMALIWQERIPDLEAKEEVTLQNEPLRQLSYTPNARYSNMLEMGMDDAMAKATVERILVLQRYRDRYTKMLEEQALLVGPAFCPTPSGVPQPYAATGFLVIEEGGRRDVIDAQNLLTVFEEQSWYSKLGLVPSVYNVLERTARRRPDATLMGVSAVLLAREPEAINERGPWATGVFGGFGSGFGALESDSPKIRALAMEYFAAMHYLTELANEQDGICS